MGFAAALLFGLSPALQVTRLRQRATRPRQVLIGAQVAASYVLLIVAGLLGRALDRAVTTHAGFEYRNVITIGTVAPRFASSAGTVQHQPSPVE